MNLEKILMALILALATLTAFIEVPYSALAILGLGLVYGVKHPIADIQERTVYLLVAFAAPTVANSLDIIPVAGAYANTIIDGVALAAGGIWVANFCISMYNRVKP